MLTVLFAGCENCKYKPVNYELQYAYVNWAKDFKYDNISFVSENREPLHFILSDSAKDFRFLTYGTAECVGEVYGKYLWNEYESNNPKIIYRLHYYVDVSDFSYYEYKLPFDVLEVIINEFSMRIPIPQSVSGDEEEDHIYELYANYSHISSLELNGKVFNDVYYRKNYNETIEIYLTRYEGLIAFKVDDELWIREQ